MAKRGLMAATTISVLIFVCPAGHAAMAESKSNPATAQSMGNPVMKEHTAEEKKGCADSRVHQACHQDANECFYEFTVNEVVQQSLKVTYPPRVWLETPEPERNGETEKKYKEAYEKSAPHPLRLTRGSKSAEVNGTYTFTRCSGSGDERENFTLGSEIDPNQTDTPPALKQSNR